MTAVFQQQVYYQPGVAVAGDFCDTNPRYFLDAGQFGLVAGPSGVTIGRFAWASLSTIDADNAPAVVNSFGSGVPSGLVHREQQADITTYLADATMVINPGFAMGLVTDGNMWVKNEGTTLAQVGQKAYADFSTGKVSFAVTGSPSTASSAINASNAVVATTFSVTGSISNNILTVTAVGSGTVQPGSTISGTNIASGTTIVSQLSGTTGGVGTYAVSIAEQSAASTTVSGTYGLLTVAGAVTGTIELGSILTATGYTGGGTVTANATNGAGLTGSGGLGTYVVSNNTAVSDVALSFTTNVETGYYAVSSGAAGELVKVSKHASAA